LIPGKSGRTPNLSGWFIAVLLATVLEGGLRKWLLPAPLHSLAYISKDVLALAFIVHAGFRQDFKNAAVLRDRVILITALLLPALTLGLTWSVSGAVIVFKNAVLWPLFAIYMAICSIGIRSEKLPNYSPSCVLVWRFWVSFSSKRRFLPFGTGTRGTSWAGWSGLQPSAHLPTCERREPSRTLPVTQLLPPSRFFG